MSECSRHRQLDLSSDSSCSYNIVKCKRKAVQKRTVKELISQYDKQYNTTVWLKYDVVNGNHVSKFPCSVCLQFQKELECMWSIRPAFIDGSTNLHISIVKDRDGTDTHAQAMPLYKNSDQAAFATIHRLLNHFTSRLWMPEPETGQRESLT